MGRELCSLGNRLGHLPQFSIQRAHEPGLNAAPDLIALYKDTLRQAADAAGGPGGWLEQEIVKEYAQIRQAVYEDQLKICWRAGNLRPCSNEDFEADVAFLIRFAQERAAFVRSQLDGQ